jgi:hypothetical protein
MTADQFVWWVRGYLAGAAGTFDPVIVREAVDRVGPAYTPPPAPSPALFPGNGIFKCQTCGQILTAPGGHVCKL